MKKPYAVPSGTTVLRRLGLLLLVALLVPAQAAIRLEVSADRPGAAISPTMWGVFFEDINYGADGGLYPEQVKNRSFEFAHPLMGWSTTVPTGKSAGTVTVESTGALHANNPHFLRLQLPPDGGLALANEGFFGVAVKKGDRYRFSVTGRGGAGPTPGLRVEILGANGARLGGGAIRPIGGSWEVRELSMRANATDPKARLVLTAIGAGTLDLDLISLFPAKTWKQRPGGLRPDMVQLLADLKPGFVRFPGGCIVEGRHLTTRYQWKETIGPVAERKLLVNRWNDEFKHRPAPDYYQSFGLGFFEYFQLCEDLGSEPLPILNCGMACQFNSGELTPLSDLEPYIQDALDLIEFANGPASSPWGQRRAAMGHPSPFGMKMVGIGNEQWGPQYLERYAAFAKVLKARHPEIRLISSAGPRPADDLFQFLWPKLRELKADIVDEHCYDRPAWFLDSARRYDAYDRNGPKVFMGEYAAQSDKVVSVLNRNNWECALAEAAFMTGLERNADVVVMSSYAPLFGHEEGWQWRPNLIWADNLRSYGTPNYYVQQMFSRNRGDRLIPIAIEGQAPVTSSEPGLYASATLDERAGELIVKVINSASMALAAEVALKGVDRPGRNGKVTVLRSDDLKAENSLDHPLQVAPVTGTIHLPGPVFAHEFPRWSMSVFRLPIQRR
jgi:alpha-N-arabinofuranosidase